MKRLRGVNALLREVYRVETEIVGKAVAQSTYAVQKDEEEDFLDKLHGHAPSRFGWLLSIKWCNIFSLISVSLTVVVVLVVASTVSSGETASRLSDTARSSVSKCFNASRTSLDEVLQAGLDSSKLLGEDILTQMLDTARTQVLDVCEYATLQSLNTFHVMKDLQARIGEWGSTLDWTDRVDLYFMYRFLFAAVQSEFWGSSKLTVGFRIMENSSVSSLTPPQAFQQVAYMASEGIATIRSRAMPSLNADNAELYTLQTNGQIDSLVGRTSDSFNSSQPFLSVISAPSNLTSTTFLWSGVWQATAQGSLLNLSFPFSARVETINNGNVRVSVRPVAVVTRVLSTVPILEAVRSVLRQYDLQGGATQPFMFIVQGDASLQLYSLILSTRGANPFSTVAVNHLSVDTIVQAAWSTLRTSGLPMGAIQVFTARGDKGSAEEFFTLALPVRTGSLSWFIVVVVSTDDISAPIRTSSARSVSENQLATQKLSAKLQESLSVIDGDVNSNRNTMLITGAILIGFGGLMAFVTAYLLNKPIMRLMKDMQDVAKMHLDNFDETNLSILLEVRNMQQCFSIMVANLREFRAFIGNAALLDDDGEYEATTVVSELDNQNDLDGMFDEEDEAEGGEPEREREPSASSPITGSTPTTGVTPLTGATPVTGASRDFNREKSEEFSQHEDASAHNDDNSSVSSGESEMKRKKERRKRRHKATLALNLHRKKASCLVINIAGFHAYVKELNKEDLLLLHGTFVSHIASLINDHKGVMDRFQGDKFFASWNTIASQGAHKSNAVKAAWGVNGACEAINHAYGHLPSITMRAAVATGHVATGNIGSDSLRGFVVLGHCVNAVYALDKLAKLYKVKFITDQEVRQAAQYTHVFRKLDQIALVDCRAMEDDVELYKTSVWQLCGEKREEAGENDDEEWMYRLQNSTKEDEEFTQATEKFLSGRIEEAKALCEKCRARGDGDEAVAVLYERINAELQAPTFSAQGERYCRRVLL